MSNNFINQAVEVVKQAIDLDNAGEYEKALPLYRRALECFVLGLKYEQNPSSKKVCAFFCHYAIQISYISNVTGDRLL